MYYKLPYENFPCGLVFKSSRYVCFCFRVDELEAKMMWLKNFERVQEIQQQIQWQPVTELEPRAFIPEVWWLVPDSDLQMLTV